ncbi:MAG: putative metal-binding motif-containing protein, partial [Myxococcota bacterium]
DDDCNDVIDDNYATDASVFFADDDNDGFGTADKSEAACEAPDGFITDSTDCDDADDEVYPGATEVCDRIDNDCDKGVDDDAVDRTAYYADQDEDSYGDPSAEILACEAPNKYVLNSDDCNDDDATINPDTLWYEDSDADGFGNPTRTQASCTRPADHARQADDCDDTTDRANPDATEVCDRLDNDCDTIVDDGGTGCDKWVNAYSGAYVIRAQEKIGTSVINDMRCVGNFALAVDYSQDPPAQGTVTCRQTRYTGFDSPQTGTILGEIALDGSFSGRLTHRFNSYANRTYDAAGALDADVIFEGTGTVRPNSMSAVAWQVEFSGE